MGVMGIPLDGHRRALLLACSAVGAVTALCFMPVNARLGLRVGVIADGIIVVLMLANFWFLSWCRTTTIPVLVCCVAVLAFLGMLATEGHIQGYLWVYVLPACVFFLTGMRMGTYLSVVVIGAAVAAAVSRPPSVIPPTIAVSIAGSLLVVVVVSCFSEISRARYERELERLAVTDALTQVANRRFFDERLAAEVIRASRYERPLSVFVFDVDHFKQINDAHGHACGDVVLRAIADCARGTLRGTDFLARLGGDEFAVLLPETAAGGLGDGGAALVAERFRASVAALEPAEGVRVSVTIGIAQLRVGDVQHEVVRRADRALYEAKRAGRNRTAVAS